MKDDRIYIDRVLECIEWITRFTAEGRDAFFFDRKTQSATLREFQTLAESTQRLSNELKEAHPEVPWESISGFRNVLVHDYLASDSSESGKSSNATCLLSALPLKPSG